MKTRLISLMLVLVMVATLVPQMAISALAAQSGSCGDNLTWTLDDEGTLTISGIGEMYYYDRDPRSIPWFSIQDSIVKVVIEKGVTFIGNAAFYNCDHLVEVQIFEDTCDIGDYAFYNCVDLRSICIPGGGVGKYAFYSCSSLAEVYLPENFRVREYAFDECDSLEDVYYAGSKWQWNKYVDEPRIYGGNNPLIYANIHYGSDGRSGSCGFDLTWALDDNGKLTISGTGDMRHWGGYGDVPWDWLRSEITSIEVAEGVTSIGNYAFYDCYNLIHVDLPSSLTSIGEWAFVSCSGLNRIKLPEGLKRIGSCAFGMCDRLISVSIPNSVTHIGYRAFFACYDLPKIDLPNSITFIDGNAFQLCTNLTQISLPEGITTIDIATFDCCSRLTSISIPVSVAYIRGCAFSDCSALSDVYYAGTKEQWNRVYKDDYDNDPLFRATIHYESEMPVKPTDPAASKYNSLWVEEHLRYAESEEYESQIVPGFSGILDEVLDDAMNDVGIKVYNLLDAVVSFLNAQGESSQNMSENELYQLILADILYSRIDENMMQEIYANNLQREAVKVLEFLVNSEEVITTIKDPETYEMLTKNLEILQKADIGSDAFSNGYTTFMNTLKDNFSLNKLKTTLSKNARVTALGIGLDLIFADMGAMEDVMQYIINCMAYESTSEEFKMVLRALAYKAETMTDEIHFPKLADYDGEVDHENMCAAINDFVDSLDVYEQKGMEAIADAAVKADQEADVAFTNNAVRKVAVLAFDTIIGCVPVLNFYGVFKTALSGGKLLVDLLTDTDKCANALDMMARTYCFSVLMDSVADDYADFLSKDNYTAASLFDESISVYRSVSYHASRYGMNYAEAKLDDALCEYWSEAKYGFNSQFYFAERVEKYTNFVNNLKKQQEDIKSILCHNPYLDYSPEAEPIEYFFNDSKLYIAACPVRMIVRSDAYGQVAVISDNEFLVREGLEHFFRVVETEPGSGEFMKVALVPDGYEVILEGTGDGSMDAAVIEYHDGELDTPEFFWDIPINEECEGHFVEISLRLQTDALIFDDGIYLGDLVEMPFSDVPEDSFYFRPVLWALDHGITSGATETTYNPNGTCLRAQVVTFLHRADGNPAPASNQNPFTDVKDGDFFYQPVLWAVEKGITNGTTATTFGSYANCNRAAVVTFLWRAAGEPEPASTDNPFTDVNETDFFYKPVLWAVENGITAGIDATHFGPTTDCNRAQVVTFLYRAYN